jgi:hypothetical protein
MTVDQIVKLQQAAPFRRFEILLADGRSVTVDHPDFLNVSPDWRLVTVSTVSGDIEIIDVLLIVSLKFRESESSAG